MNKQDKLKEVEELIEEVKDNIVIKGAVAIGDNYGFPICSPIDAVNILEWVLSKIKELSK